MRKTSDKILWGKKAMNWFPQLLAYSCGWCGIFGRPIMLIFLQWKIKNTIDRKFQNSLSTPELVFKDEIRRCCRSILSSVFSFIVMVVLATLIMRVIVIPEFKNSLLCGCMMSPTSDIYLVDLSFINNSKES